MKAGDKTSQDYMEEMFNMEESTEDLGVSEVTNFYKGANVFITGGSGFLGKLLIEKLLRCTNVNKIYLMMRPKKGKTPEERLDAQLKDPLYDRLKRERPNFAKKLICVVGETSAPDLGISAEDLKILEENIHVIFHCAANVRFDEKLRKVVETNVRGTKLLLELAKEMKHFKVFVHISTAFSHCTYKFIEEKFYEPPIDADKVLALINILDDEALERVTPSIVGKFPNTYTFSKAIAEDVVQKYGKDIPTCVVRPSIVISTYEEPIAGWIDNLYGPTGASVGICVGLIRTLYACKKKVADIIPADYVTNNIVVAAWDTAVTWHDNQQKLDWEKILPTPEELKDPVIYNCVSSPQNPITWESFTNLNFNHGIEMPPLKVLWYVFLFVYGEKWKYKLARFFFHLVPGLILDLLSILLGKKPQLLDAYKKIHKFSGVISYFSTQQWKFTNDQVLRLWSKLTPIDKKLYDFYVPNYDWDEYMDRHYIGLRVFLLNDPVSTAKQGRKRYQRLTILHYVIVSIFGSCFAYFAGYIIYKIISLVFSFFVFLWNRY